MHQTKRLTFSYPKKLFPYKKIQNCKQKRTFSGNLENPPSKHEFTDIPHGGAA